MIILRERIARGEGAEAYREGRTLPMEAVAGLALSLLDEMTQALPHPDTAPDTTPDAARPTERTMQRRDRNVLTEREIEVLRLVAQGFSSKAIGRQLSIATRTVNYHLTSVFNKLGVDTRAQAVAVATQRGLL
jgi:DNA-binding NarL/FixJ family response regulator